MVRGMKGTSKRDSLESQISRANTKVKVILRSNTSYLSQILLNLTKCCEVFVEVKFSRRSNVKVISRSNTSNCT